MSWLQRLQKSKTLPAVVQPEAGQLLGKTITQAANDAQPPALLSVGCWPHGDGWTDAEIDRFTGRVLRLQNLGGDLLKAEGMAETLLQRDRDGDDRRMCAECSNLSGRQCRNAQGAELGLPSHRTADVSPIRFMLQRCAGYRTCGPSTSEITVTIE